ncbi:hypothetical protein EWB00_008165 [Schistosoma japonicum]|uniref:Uncharacterized protein n=1 Tax=Schistosoma japonicum TaxID=6182 RepID=A0A4Z2CRB8_SCHJA|nr:hypothetical protein EWB00_008165 [Schistosoma japonicum]
MTTIYGILILTFMLNESVTSLTKESINYYKIQEKELKDINERDKKLKSMFRKFQENKQAKVVDEFQPDVNSTILNKLWYFSFTTGNCLIIVS